MASYDQQWYMDTGATSHLSSHIGNLQTSSLNHNFHSVIVRNGSSIPVTHCGHVQIHNPYRPLHLRNVLVTPNSIKNLVSVRKFTTDNKCSIDFDPYGFTVRDYNTRQTLLRCDNTGDLYPLHVVASAFALLTNNHSLWHQHLGHPGDALDVKNAFLYDHLTETVYMHQPPRFTDSSHSDYVCLLQKSLYGLKQPPELRFSDFPAMLFESVSITAKPTRLFSSFIKGQTQLTYYYMWMISFLQLLLFRSCNTKYATEILERAQMLNFNSCRTPVDTEKKLGPEGSAVTNPTLYRSLARALQYLTFTRPDLSYVVQQDTLSRSSAEAEYCGVTNAVAETSWIRNLLHIFTKRLLYPLFADFRSSLSVCKSPAPTAWAY
nr:ribonuclease H-like domain-containing protein [Tanacetum cinerariifolium]